MTNPGGQAHRTCIIRWAAAATCGPERSQTEPSTEPGETTFPQVRNRLCKSVGVVRGGVEPPTYRFGEGL